MNDQRRQNEARPCFERSPLSGKQCKFREGHRAKHRADHLIYDRPLTEAWAGTSNSLRAAERALLEEVQK